MIERNENEKRWIRKAIGGESSAFGSLYDKYQPKIYRFILFKVSHREEAEDLTHKVFLSALENIHKFKDQGFPFSSWLFRIARNKVIDYYRTKKDISPLENAPDITSSEDNVELISKKLNLERIYISLQKLTDEQKEVVILRFVEGLSHKEVAQILDKKTGAIRVLQHRAISEIKKMIE